jgi:hypothetical protein
MSRLGGYSFVHHQGMQHAKRFALKYTLVRKGSLQYESLRFHSESSDWTTEPARRVVASIPRTVLLARSMQSGTADEEESVAGA